MAKVDKRVIGVAVILLVGISYLVLANWGGQTVPDWKRAECSEDLDCVIDSCCPFCPGGAGCVNAKYAPDCSEVQACPMCYTEPKCECIEGSCERTG